MEGARQGVKLWALVGEEEELSHSPAVDRDARIDAASASFS
jgi:hypothetical protein